ncbi:MAG: glycerate kinase [Cephaloticoccus sp.]|nr:glycerate kinase [Cephaloticoccus sp.]
MRVLIAFDKFKDSLTAPAACELAAGALHRLHPDWTISICPLTDGGEGFSEILTRACRGTTHHHRVTGPRGQSVEAAFGMVSLGNIPDKARARLSLPEGLSPTTSVALIEMAVASGLALLDQGDRDPWQTTTLGTGELIQHATALGAGIIILGVGGSATNDLGLGALQAMGLQLLTADNTPVSPPTPAAWDRVTHISGHLPHSIPPIFIACDVANPLLGSNGAAAVYGPQKGLLPADLSRLESASERLASLLCAHCQQPVSMMQRPGAGAAGGIAFGLMTATGAQLLPGAEFVGAWLDLESQLTTADMIITGEGRFDESSLSGKGPGALAQKALTQGKPVHVFAGQIIAPATLPTNLHLHVISPDTMPLTEALKNAPRLLTAAIDISFTPDA